MGFTCEYDTPGTAAIAGSSFVPAVIAVIAPTQALGVAAVTAVSAAPAILAVPSVSAIPATQHDLPDHFQPKLDTMDIQVHTAHAKKGVFLKDSPQARIIAQNYSCGYHCLYLLISVGHPVNSTRPTVIIQSPPVQ